MSPENATPVFNAAAAKPASPSLPQTPSFNKAAEDPANPSPPKAPPTPPTPRPEPKQELPQTQIQKFNAASIGPDKETAIASKANEEHKILQERKINSKNFIDQGYKDCQKAKQQGKDPNQVTLGHNLYSQMDKNIQNHWKNEQENVNMKGRQRTTAEAAAAKIVPEVDLERFGPPPVSILNRQNMARMRAFNKVEADVEYEIAPVMNNHLDNEEKAFRQPIEQVRQKLILPEVQINSRIQSNSNQNNGPSQT